MDTYGKAFYRLKEKLGHIYEEREAAAIAHEVIEEVTGLSKIERLVQKDTLLDAVQLNQLDDMLSQLMSGKPLQYVTGKTYFMGQLFSVNEHVLIPRPETEELVTWILEDFKNDARELFVLDIGTGSGCIPISLKLGMPGAHITSCDISTDAIKVAALNAAYLQANIHLKVIDFLDEQNRGQLGWYHIIVSNPPYIPISEKETLDANVRDFEPGTALFVPDNDALLFYRKIALFGQEHLVGDGCIYCELHRDYATAALALFDSFGYIAELKKDIHGNDRMLKARKR